LSHSNAHNNKTTTTTNHYILPKKHKNHRWSGATKFDALRLFYALSQLVEMQILSIDGEHSREHLINIGEIHDGELTLEEEMEVERKIELFGPFKLTNVLVRKVASSMVLEAQKKSIKRQALMDRCLAKQLPEKLELLRIKKAQIHIPWYYQIELPQKKFLRGMGTNASIGTGGTGRDTQSVSGQSASGGQPQSSASGVSATSAPKAGGSGGGNDRRPTEKSNGV